MSKRNLADLTEEIIKFRNERDWKQFHSTAQMIMALFVESAELAENFQWVDDKDIVEHVNNNQQQISDELADVLYWVLLIAADLGVDIERAFTEKMLKNAQKYPVDVFKGKSKKYNSHH